MLSSGHAVGRTKSALRDYKTTSSTSQDLDLPDVIRAQVRLSIF